MKPVLLPLLLPMLLPALFCSAGRGLAPLPVAAPPATSALPFSPFAARVGLLPTGEVTTVLRSAREYQALLGRPAPPAIDFSRQWVVFYGAGLQPTTAARAAISGVELTEGDHVLLLHTVLLVPEHGLDLAPGRCIPFALATIPRPRCEIKAVRAEHVYVMSL
jgi:hypothetical protein